MLRQLPCALAITWWFDKISWGLGMTERGSSKGSNQEWLNGVIPSLGTEKLPDNLGPGLINLFSLGCNPYCRGGPSFTLGQIPSFVNPGSTVSQVKRCNEGSPLRDLFL